MFNNNKNEKNVLIATNLSQLIACHVLTKHCCCSSAQRLLAPFIQMKLMNMGYIYSSHFAMVFSRKFKD